MRIFNEATKCSSTLVINGVKYTLNKANVQTGNVFIFTVDEPNKERDQIFLTTEELKAIYLLITTEEKK